MNPPGYSEHATGLAADLNTPEHTSLDEGFENTAAFRWLCQHAVQYGFILRYPKSNRLSKRLIVNSISARRLISILWTSSSFLRVYPLTVRK